MIPYRWAAMQSSPQESSVKTEIIPQYELDYALGYTILRISRTPIPYLSAIVFTFEPMFQALPTQPLFMATLLILNQQPYDGTDVTWNALRLARQLNDEGVEVRIFLMNDSVDLARNGITPPDGIEDMVQMTKDLISKGVLVKVCGTCQNRCGILKGEPYYEGAQFSTMAECSAWVQNSEKVLTF